MGEVRYGSIGGLEHEVPQSRLYYLCINVALLDGLAIVIFGRPPIGGSFPPFPLAAPLIRSTLQPAVCRFATSPPRRRLLPALHMTTGW